MQPTGEARFERGPLGQVKLHYAPNAHAVIQLDGRARLYGLWAMGTAASDHPEWKPLKEILETHGGVSGTGGARGIKLRTSSQADVSTIIATAVEATRNLGEAEQHYRSSLGCFQR